MSLFVHWSDTPTPAERLSAYLIRVAPVHAADQTEHLRRYLAGLAVKRRVRIGKQAGRVIQLRRGASA